jgi:hypothetical protein
LNSETRILYVFPGRFVSAASRPPLCRGEFVVGDRWVPAFVVPGSEKTGRKSYKER